MAPKGNYSILRSTREVSGDAEEVYRDLLLGDIVHTPVQGRYRWEKRLSHEEVLAVVEDVPNHESIPFARKLFDTKTRPHSKTTAQRSDGSSVILKEWRKMGGVYRTVRSCLSLERSERLVNDIPHGIRILHRSMKSGSGFASSRDLVLFQDHYRTDDGCYVIYEISVNGDCPVTTAKQSYVRAEVLLSSYLISPSGRDVGVFPLSNLEMPSEHVLPIQ